MSRKARTTLLSALVLTCCIVVAPAQTPDGETPAEEASCTKYEGEGARHGLCVAYCEAQDCDSYGYALTEACLRISQKFLDYSVKKDFVPAPSDKFRISCRETACTAEDRLYCAGTETDCVINGVCTHLCTRTFEGFGNMGEPLCSAGHQCQEACIPEDPIPSQ